MSARDRLIAGVLEEVAAREALLSFQDIKARSRDTSPARDGLSALLRTGCSVIAEIKRAMNGRMLLDATAPITDLARDFEEGGAHLIACQTERLRFQGSLQDMLDAREAVELPMFCRDIILDPYQIHEARAHGADLVLLMVSALDQPTLESLLDRTESLGMNALVEAHTAEEVDRAVAAGAKILGINARNLKTLEVDMGVYGKLAPGLPDNVVKVAESGVKGVEDLRAYADQGADCVLVGEGLVTAGDPGDACRRLVAAGAHPTSRG